MLLTRDELEKILQEKLGASASSDKIKETAGAIMEAHGIWDEVDVTGGLGAEYSCQCKDICRIGEAYEKGMKIKVFVSK